MACRRELAHAFCVVLGTIPGTEGAMTTHTHFSEQERVSSAMSMLMALALVSALAFWLVLLPY
jgi:flagellar biogenesis protein FliO